VKRTDEQILQAYLAGGRLKVIPAKRSRKIIVLRWLASYFEFGRKYSEAEVNAKIADFHPDFATLRRELYDSYFVRSRRRFVLESA
jgi:hypothetical protein